MSEKNVNHPNLKMFKQHGFIPIADSGRTQVFGDCPFCGADRKLYVNVESKKWDCKVCERNGGFQSFLQELVEISKGHFKQSRAITLSKERGIKLSTFRRFETGFNPLRNAFLIPVRDISGERIWDLRTIKEGAPKMSTYGCQVGILGWQYLTDDIKTIWLMEGEFDFLAMTEVLSSAGSKEELALAVPGATTFKDEWALLFKDKRVNVVYDNDFDKEVKGKIRKGAGKAGSIKVYNKLKTIAQDLRFVHWPDKYPDKFDMNDFYKREKLNPQRTLRGLRALLHELPKGIDEEQIRIETGEQPEKLTGAGVKASAVYEAYQRWLYLPDTDVLDILFATVLANRLPGEPIWLFLVAPPGGAKTELLMTLSDAPRIRTTTSITPHSLVSGANFAGGDPSLIPKLNNRVLIIKDFTTILSMNSIAREEIIGIFRDAYDGKTEKHFGNGVFRSYKSKFGILAGVTPIIEQFSEQHTALGERFLSYRLRIEGTIEMLERVIMNTTNEEAMRNELRQVAKDTLDHEFEIIPVVPRDITKKVLQLAQWTAQMRGMIFRDRYSKEVTHKPYHEYATRISKEYYKLLLGMGQFHQIDTVTDEQYSKLKHLAVSSAPSKLEDIIHQMYRRNPGKAYRAEEIAKMVMLPPATCKIALENLGMLGLVRRFKATQIKTEWFLHDNTVNMMEEAELYS